jgi:hypothetical protein
MRMFDRRRYTVLLGLFLLLPFLAGCREGQAGGETGKYEVRWLEPGEGECTAVGPTSLSLQILLPDSQTPVTNLNLSIKGDMTHPGMVPVVRQLAGGDEAGVYTVPWEWTMSGDWVVTVTAVDETSSSSYRFPISVSEKGDCP